MKRGATKGVAPLAWHTETRTVRDLIPWEHNPRRMTPKQSEDLEKSLTRLNLMSIPVINTDGVIVSGHQRVRTLIELGRGRETIDVRVPNRPLTEDELREANLRENKNVGEWDEGLLSQFEPDLLRDVGFDEKFLKSLQETDVSIDNWEFTPTEDLYIITIRGPHDQQAEVKKRLAGMEDAEIEVSHVRRS